MGSGLGAPSEAWRFLPGASPGRGVPGRSSGDRRSSGDSGGVPGTVYLIRATMKTSLRRRDSGCPEPPPQTRTCSIPASGSSVVLAHQASDTFHANTSSCCKQRDSVMRGLAIPSFSMARPKAAHVKRLRLPPRRFSHLNASEKGPGSIKLER